VHWFALSSMVEILARDEWARKGKQGDPPKAISPFMLYYYARRYDDIPGEDPLGGSTARGGMKAWFSQGASHEDLWTQKFLDDKPAGTDWIAEDNCGAIYRRSLLYLVSNAFEHQRGMPLLGMQKFVDPANLSGAQPAGAEEWRWIMGPTGQDAPIADRTNSASHGSFSSDKDTQVAIQARIAERMR